MSLRTFATVLFLVVTLCNVFTDAADSRIVNGTTALPGQFPYQVSLRTASNNHFCGGSIIKPNWVLTAAHCLIGRIPSGVYVVVGTNTLLSGGFAYSVTVLTPHPLYNSTTIVYDVGLVRTAVSIAYSGLIQSIPLATVLPLPGTDGVVTGWGQTQYPSTFIPNQLQSLITTYITTLDCQTRIGAPIAFSDICAFKKYTGVCLGDSGGPFVVNGKQIGIVSWGFPCAIGKPDGYTNVPMLLSWILANSVP